MSNCKAELCPMWDGNTCPCATFNLDRENPPKHGVFAIETTTLHPFPNGTPTDAEHQAERDADHAAEIAAWKAGGECLCGPALRIADTCLCGAR